MKKDLIHGLGPNQRAIMRILEKKPNLTEVEIATLVYDEPVKVGDYKYQAVSHSLRALCNRGLLEKTEWKTTWRIKKKVKKA